MDLRHPPQDAPSATLERAAPRSPSWFRISAEPGYLRSELYGRRTVEDTRRFLEAVLPVALEHGIPNVLVCVRSSLPVFTIERYGFSRYLELVFKSKYKIALVGDSIELRIAHQYMATIARMRGVNLRAFSEETAAIAWLTSAKTPSPSPESV